MRYQLDQIVAFLHVVEAGSISAAAERLNLAKSVVSKRVADLEKELGVELLRRTSRGIMPTDRGRSFYSNARALLRELDNAIEEITEDGALSGQLRVTVPMSCANAYQLDELMFSFVMGHPRLELALDFDDKPVDVAREGYDLAIRVTHFEAPSLIVRKLATLPRVLCCSRTYAEQCGVPANLDELAKHSCITSGRANALWEFDSGAHGKPLTVNVRSRIVTNNTDAMRAAALAGLGIALVPLFTVRQALQAGQLIRVLPSIRPAADTLCALYPRTRRPSRKTAALVDFLRDAFRRRHWESEQPPDSAARLNKRA